MRRASPSPRQLRKPADWASRRLHICWVLVPALWAAGCDTSPRPHPYPSQSDAIAPRADERQCLAALGERHAGFTPLPDRYFSPGCSALGTVRLFSLEGDRAEIEVSNLAQVGCPIANPFANWVRFGVDRAARRILGSRIARVETMGSYACRTIAGTDHLSAHATASAIDVSGFTLADGRRVTVMGSWYAGTDAERYFLHMIHQSACRQFGTVLGPDYNLAHRNHLHVELSAAAFCR